MRASILIAALLASCSAAPAQAHRPKTQFKVCSDGTTVRYTQRCPAPTSTPPPAPTPIPDPTPVPVIPPPPPSPAYVLSPTLVGLAPIASEFDPNVGLQAAWGTGAIPASASPDVVGAFRFICGGGQLLYDDPIVKPGRPGTSHLHQFYGNTAADAYSTFTSLRQGGTSSCAPIQYPGNRSAYWTPALLDGKGNVVQPDYIAVYYKRRPASDPKCSLTSGDAQAEGNCVPIPNGLRFTFGWDPAQLSSIKTGGGYWNCTGLTAVPGTYADLPTAFAKCPAGNQLLAVIDAPSCWDGVNLDTPDHRSHVGYPGYGDWGYLKCDAQHPYVIPQFHLAIAYSIKAGDDTSLWTLSSDAMAPTQPKGFTLHGDYFEAWDVTVKMMWTDNCINLKLNCSGGDLGNGKQLIGAQQPAYGWTNPNRIVPIPPMPGM